MDSSIPPNRQDEHLQKKRALVEHLRSLSLFHDDICVELEKLEREFYALANGKWKPRAHLPELEAYLDAALDHESESDRYWDAVFRGWDETEIKDEIKEVQFAINRDLLRREDLEATVRKMKGRTGGVTRKRAYREDEYNEGQEKQYRAKPKKRLKLVHALETSKEGVEGEIIHPWIEIWYEWAAVLDILASLETAALVEMLRKNMAQGK